MTEIDDIKLRHCDGCDLVKYCSVECQENHRSQHEEACKQRVAELRDELLFKQSSCLGDFPICTLPLPLDVSKFSSMACCSKFICAGCALANYRRETEMRLPQSCPFCRKPAASTDEECDKRMMKRIEANDPNALRFEGSEQYKKGDYQSAFGYYTKAAELGNAWAHYTLSLLYRDGEGVEKDEEKEIHHLEEAAIGGHPDARYFLGMHEWNNNYNAERAVKHWIIGATLSDDDSLKKLMEAFRQICRKRSSCCSSPCTQGHRRCNQKSTEESGGRIWKGTPRPLMGYYLSVIISCSSG